MLHCAKSTFHHWAIGPMVPRAIIYLGAHGGLHRVIEKGTQMLKKTWYVASFGQAFPSSTYTQVKIKGERQGQGICLLILRSFA